MSRVQEFQDVKISRIQDFHKGIFADGRGGVARHDWRAWYWLATKRGGLNGNCRAGKWARLGGTSQKGRLKKWAGFYDLQILVKSCDLAIKAAGYLACKIITRDPLLEIVKSCPPASFQFLTSRRIPVAYLLSQPTPCPPVMPCYAPSPVCQIPSWKCSILEILNS